MTDPDFDDLPWDEIQQVSKEGIFEEVYKKIPMTRFRFAAKEENHQALVESALRSLKKNNPDTSYQQATMLADLMQQYARKALEG